MATIKGYVEIIKLFAYYGVDTRIMDNEGDSLLQLAQKYSNRPQHQTIKFLKECTEYYANHFQAINSASTTNFLELHQQYTSPAPNVSNKKSNPFPHLYRLGIEREIEQPFIATQYFSAIPPEDLSYPQAIQHRCLIYFREGIRLKAAQDFLKVLDFYSPHTNFRERKTFLLAVLEICPTHADAKKYLSALDQLSLETAAQPSFVLR